MIGWLLKKPPSSGAARNLLPDGEKKGAASTSYSSPHRGEVGRRPGEGAFNQRNCAIWNDIQRALETK